MTIYRPRYCIVEYIVCFEGLTRVSHQDGLSLDLDEIVIVLLLHETRVLLLCITYSRQIGLNSNICNLVFNWPNLYNRCQYKNVRY